MKLLTKKEAQKKLAEMGIKVNVRQITRAASPNDAGVRKLPFFRDPITGKLVIDEEVLVKFYTRAQSEAISETN